MADNLRVFLAHPKGWGDEEITDAVGALTRLYEQGLAKKAARTGEAPRKVVVVSGRDDFMRGKARGYGWKQWSQSISGTSMDGRPRFHQIIVPSLEVGRATADVLRSCLARKRDVFFWNPADDSRQRVVDVRTVDPDSWQRGWEVVVAK